MNTIDSSSTTTTSSIYKQPVGRFRAWFFASLFCTVCFAGASVLFCSLWIAYGIIRKWWFSWFLWMFLICAVLTIMSLLTVVRRWVLLKLVLNPSTAVETNVTTQEQHSVTTHQQHYAQNMPQAPPVSYQMNEFTDIELPVEPEPYSRPLPYTVNQPEVYLYGVDRNTSQYPEKRMQPTSDTPVK
jgi:hypothetical protein